jgi:hypothetical protein
VKAGGSFEIESVKHVLPAEMRESLAMKVLAPDADPFP